MPFFRNGPFFKVGFVKVKCAPALQSIENDWRHCNSSLLSLSMRWFGCIFHDFGGPQVLIVRFRARESQTVRYHHVHALSFESNEVLRFVRPRRKHLSVAIMYEYILGCLFSLFVSQAPNTTAQGILIGGMSRRVRCLTWFLRMAGLFGDFLLAHRQGCGGQESLIIEGLCDEWFQGCQFGTGNTGYSDT
jgi:hypothetical protein